MLDSLPKPREGSVGKNCCSGHWTGAACSVSIWIVCCKSDSPPWAIFLRKPTRCIPSGPYVHICNSHAVLTRVICMDGGSLLMPGWQKQRADRPFLPICLLFRWSGWKVLTLQFSLWFRHSDKAWAVLSRPGSCSSSLTGPLCRLTVSSRQCLINLSDQS